METNDKLLTNVQLLEFQNIKYFLLLLFDITQSCQPKDCLKGDAKLKKHYKTLLYLNF